MNLTLTRDVFGDTFTLGRLDVDGKTFGFVCEDKDRGLDATMTPEHIAGIKVHGKTAIPVGTYTLGIRYSPGHKREVIYLQDVPGFRYILIHTGNTADDTEGCQLPGLIRDVAHGAVGKSTPAVAWLEQAIMPRIRAGEVVTYTITREGA